MFTVSSIEINKQTTTTIFYFYIPLQDHGEDALALFPQSKKDPCHQWPTHEIV